MTRNRKALTYFSIAIILLGVTPTAWAAASTLSDSAGINTATSVFAAWWQTVVEWAEIATTLRSPQP